MSHKLTTTLPIVILTVLGLAVPALAADGNSGYENSSCQCPPPPSSDGSGNAERPPRPPREGRPQGDGSDSASDRPPRPPREGRPQGDGSDSASDRPPRPPRDGQGPRGPRPEGDDNGRCRCPIPQSQAD